MKKVIIFDLYDTVLKDISFDFNLGIKFIYEEFFSKVCTLEEFMDYLETFKPLYEKRYIDYSEVSLINEEIRVCFEHFGVTHYKNYDELDYIIMNKMQRVSILSEISFTLKKLKELGIDMYILSNTIFTGSSTRQLLKDFEILKYFKKVFASADYGVRKPGAKFYQTAIDEILSEKPNIKIEDVLYVGNDYITDVIGATSMGLDTVWYNVSRLLNEKKLKIIEIDDFKKILEVV